LYSATKSKDTEAQKDAETLINDEELIMMTLSLLVKYLHVQWPDMSINKTESKVNTLEHKIDLRPRDQNV